MTQLVLTSNNYLQEVKKTITADLLNEYCQQLDNSDATIKTYMACVKRFVSWLEERQINAVDYETIVTYKKYLKSHTEEKDGEEVLKEMKAKAINTHLTAIKDLFKFLERKGVKNVAKSVKKEKVNNDFVRDSLTTEQVQQILNSIDTSTENGARAYAMFKLMVQTGLRECEIVRADINDIKTKGNNTVLYIQGKGESTKNNYVVLYPSVINALQNYFLKRGAKPSEPLFTSTSNHNSNGRLTTRTVQRIVKGLYANNGIVSDNITTHSTRHTAVTLSILNGANIQQAQAMARHKNINTTMIYFHNLNRLEDNAEGKLEQLFN